MINTNQQFLGISEISRKEMHELVSVFNNCQSLADNSKREAIIRDLPADISGNIDRHDSRRFDIHNIVEACLKYPDGISQLFESIFHFEGNSQAVQRLKRHINFLKNDSILTYGQFYTIKSLAKGIPIKKVEGIFKKSYPEIFTPIPNVSEAEILEWMLEALAKLPQLSGGTFPILEFVKRLAIDQPSLSAKLKDWLDKACDHLEVSEQQRKSLCQLADPQESISSKQPPTLMILLRPYEVDANSVALDKQRFAVSAWLWQDSNTYGTQIKPCDTSNEDVDYHTLDEIPNEISNLLNNVCLPLLRLEMKNLQIDVFLPYELLSHDIECNWSVQTGIGKQEPIGVKKPVVVRSSERIISPKFEMWLKWKEKCRELARHFDNTNFKNDYNEYVTIIHSLDYTNQNERLLDAINEGIPYALWLRMDTSSSANLEQLFELLKIQRDEYVSPDLQQLFDLLLRENGLQNLPTTIWRKRQQVQLYGFRLKILWDDDKRLPYDPFAIKRLKQAAKVEKQ